MAGNSDIEIEALDETYSYKIQMRLLYVCLQAGLVHRGSLGSIMH